MAKFVSGMIDKNGERAAGNKYTASVISRRPWAVLATYDDAFEQMPIATVELSSSVAGVATAVQSSPNSLAIYTDSPDPVALYFLATDKGLGS